MMHVEICIILPGLFGVCPQTQKVFVLLVKGVNLMKCGFLWGKAIGHLWRESMVMGLIKEGEGERVKIGARFNRVKKGE